MPYSQEPNVQKLFFLGSAVRRSFLETAAGGAFLFFFLYVKSGVGFRKARATKRGRGERGAIEDEASEAARGEGEASRRRREARNIKMRRRPRFHDFFSRIKKRPRAKCPKRSLVSNSATSFFLLVVVVVFQNRVQEKLPVPVNFRAGLPQTSGLFFEGWGHGRGKKKRGSRFFRRRIFF